MDILDDDIESVKEISGVRIEQILSRDKLRLVSAAGEPSTENDDGRLYTIDADQARRAIWHVIKSSKTPVYKYAGQAIMSDDQIGPGIVACRSEYNGVSLVVVGTVGENTYVYESCPQHLLACVFPEIFNEDRVLEIRIPRDLYDEEGYLVDKDGRRYAEEDLVSEWSQLGFDVKRKLHS